MVGGIATTRRRAIRVAANRHQVSGLLTAYSQDLPGLAVTGRTPEAIGRWLRQAAW